MFDTLPFSKEATDFKLSINEVSDLKFSGFLEKDEGCALAIRNACGIEWLGMADGAGNEPCTGERNGA